MLLLRALAPRLRSITLVSTAPSVASGVAARGPSLIKMPEPASEPTNAELSAKLDVIIENLNTKMDVLIEKQEAKVRVDPLQLRIVMFDTCGTPGM